MILSFYYGTGHLCVKWSHVTPQRTTRCHPCFTTIPLSTSAALASHGINSRSVRICGSINLGASIYPGEFHPSKARSGSGQTSRFPDSYHASWACFEKRPRVLSLRVVGYQDRYRARHQVTGHFIG